MQLDRVEARVVGSLVEKELTTPQQYPLTLNALVAACNQTSNRDPVVTLSEAEVLRALDSLKADHLVRFVLPSHGRSVVRYRHVLHDALGLEERPRALLAVLLLRGPQTLGELRSRTERMAPMERLEDVESELRSLASRVEPLVVRLPRRAGQKEDRFAELATAGDRAGSETDSDPGVVGGEQSPSGAGSGGWPGASTQPFRHEERDDRYPGTAVEAGTAPRGEAVDPNSTSWPGELHAVRSEIADLRNEIDDLRRQLHNLRQELGEDLDD